MQLKPYTGRIAGYIALGIACACLTCNLMVRSPLDVFGFEAVDTAALLFFLAYVIIATADLNLRTRGIDMRGRRVPNRFAALHTLEVFFLVTGVGLLVYALSFALDGQWRDARGASRVALYSFAFWLGLLGAEYALARWRPARLQVLMKESTWRRARLIRVWAIGGLCIGLTGVIASLDIGIRHGFLTAASLAFVSFGFVAVSLASRPAEMVAAAAGIGVMPSVLVVFSISPWSDAPARPALLLIAGAFCGLFAASLLLDRATRKDLNRPSVSPVAAWGGAVLLFAGIGCFAVWLLYLATYEPSNTLELPPVVQLFGMCVFGASLVFTALYVVTPQKKRTAAP
jgi:hypothetical protein